MTYWTHAEFKNWWHETKPIRGRAEDVRPIGERRRDWERIVRVHLPDNPSEDAYAARLYRTNVVTYYPDGLVELECDQWATPTTAEFIQRYSPVSCVKRAKRLWVTLGGGIKVPIPLNGPLKIREGENGWYAINAETIKRNAVDRTKMKEARAKIRPFMLWAKTFLGMSEGWVMDETRAQFAVTTELSWRRVHYHFGLPNGIKNVVCDLPLNQWEREKHKTLPEDARKYRYDYEGALELLTSEDINTRFKVLLTILDSIEPLAKRKVKEEEREDTWANGQTYKTTVVWFDFQFDFDQLERRMTKILKANEDVHKVVETPLSTCISSNLVI